VPPSLLADLALSEVSERLKGFGSYLEGDARDAISALLKTLESGLTGTLGPGYHLSAIDPGIGKSLSVSTFLRTWKAQGFIPSSSVLVGLSRLVEIKSYMREAGLDRDDVAVLTSDKELNDLGGPPDQHGTARVMFTTQQMIEKRTRGRKFADTDEFHFQGQPRSLRIWDESLVPAQPLKLRVDDLASLPRLLRHQSPEFAQEVQRFVSRLWGAKEHEAVVIPDTFKSAPKLSKAVKDAVMAEVLETMDRLSGRTTTMVDVGAAGLHLAGASAPLPPDFAPVVILDASGRVRSTYRIWENEIGDLHRLPHAANDYRNLKVNVWQRSVGQTGAIKKPGALDEIVQAVAEVIDSDPASSWLVVCYKEHPIDEKVRAALKSDLGDRLNFLTWGMHHGTNDFADCRKVVLVGQLTYGDAGYSALAAASGSAGVNQSVEILRDLKVGEYRHNLLQALTRASARKSKNGVAGACHAYVITSPGNGVHGLLADTFPGCTIETWAPAVVAEAKGQAGQLIGLLEGTKRRGERRLAKRELGSALNINPQNLSRLLNHRDVVAYFDRYGVNVTHHHLDFGVWFDPYPGGGFTVDDLDNE
jgi:hypothetical protein